MSRRCASRTRAPDELLAVVGPTASGKTALAVALAERLGGEIISADSVQIYRGFDVGFGQAHGGRARTGAAPPRRDARPPRPVDAAAWAELAEAAIADVRARGRVPIVCGGTFLWVKALLFGLAEAPAASAADARAPPRASPRATGRPALHARLREVDAEIAARLHPNDFVRVSRALEVHELTGKPMSAWQREHGFARAAPRARLVAIACDPAALTERIRRARARGSRRAGPTRSRRCWRTGSATRGRWRSVGYAQVRAVLAGDIAAGELETPSCARPASSPAASARGSITPT